MFFYIKVLDCRDYDQIEGVAVWMNFKVAKLKGLKVKLQDRIEGRKGTLVVAAKVYKMMLEVVVRED